MRASADDHKKSRAQPTPNRTLPHVFKQSVRFLRIFDMYNDGCCKKTGQEVQFGGGGVKNGNTSSINFFTRQRALRALSGRAAVHAYLLVAET